MAGPRPCLAGLGLGPGLGFVGLSISFLGLADLRPCLVLVLLSLVWQDLVLVL